MDTCIQDTLREIVVANRDRFFGFGFDLNSEHFLDDDGNKNTEQELTEDRIYRCKQIGKRSYKTKKPKNSIETKSKAEEN